MGPLCNCVGAGLIFYLQHSRSLVDDFIRHNNTKCSLTIWPKQINQTQQTVAAPSRPISQIRTGRLHFISPQSNKIVACLIYFHHILGKYGQRGRWVWIFAEDSLRFIPQLCKTAPVLFWSGCVSVSDAADLPADGLLLVSDARLPECTVGLFQAESDGSLQVIFVVACQVNHIYTHKDKGTLITPLRSPPR